MSSVPWNSILLHDNRFVNKPVLTGAALAFSFGIPSANTPFAGRPRPRESLLISYQIVLGKYFWSFLCFPPVPIP